MPVCVDEINRISQAVGITVYAALVKRAQRVWAVEAHQHGVIRPIALTQQVVAGNRGASFTVESQLIALFTESGLKPVGRVLP